MMITGNKDGVQLKFISVIYKMNEAVKKEEAGRSPG